MIGKASGRVVRILASARLATLLLAFVSAWAVLASFIPQGAPADAQVVAWASAHPLAESLVRVAGLHRAFTAPVFVLSVIVLALSTAVCAWQRTKAAIVKGRLLRDVRTIDAHELVANHDFEIDCDPALPVPDILPKAADTLRRLGIRTRSRGDTITAVSHGWTVLGSPVFHWALLALVVVASAGALWRSSGLMGLAVGQEKTDAPDSYGAHALSAGPLHDWRSVRRTIRVDAFDITYRTGGVNRGPTPTVAVLDASGRVIKSQRVYPNHTLRTGSLTIYPSDYGLSATVSVVGTNGIETQRLVGLMDFSGKAEGGTVAVAPLIVAGDPSASRRKVFVSVALDRTEGGYLGRVPRAPTAHVVVSSLDDVPLTGGVLRPGEGLALPTGGTLRLLDVGYYARLQLVDDPSVPALYLCLAAAVTGLALATLGRQGVFAAAVIETSEGTRLAVRVRSWRNVTSSRSEIESELAEALGVRRGGDTT